MALSLVFGAASSEKPMNILCLHGRKGSYIQEEHCFQVDISLSVKLVRESISFENSFFPCLLMYSYDMEILIFLFLKCTIHILTYKHKCIMYA